MAQLTWDGVGQKVYETGVDHGVLYLPNAQGVYDKAHAWNGLVSVTESPSGAESSAQYADNIKYLNLVSAEEFGATIEAFTYPDAFGLCDGTVSPEVGVIVGQQGRAVFGLCYRTKIGDDIKGTDAGYKLHLIYGALAAPSEKAYTTVNDSPEAITFSWELSTTPVPVTGLKPTASLTIDSTKVDAAKLKTLEDKLYGTQSLDGVLPTPDEVIAIFAAAAPTEVKPVKPSFAANKITIPTVTGVEYLIDGVVVTGDVDITKDTLVVARPTAGHVFPAVVDVDWLFEHS